MSKLKYKKYIPVVIEFIQIRFSSFLIYKYYELNGYTGKRNNDNFRQQKTYKGTITTHQQKRIKRAVDLFLQASPKKRLYNPITQKSHTFQLAFITLTISNNERFITGKEGYEKLLKPFLTWMRDTKKISTYIWKAEIQKRGQLHYHITINQFLSFTEIKHKWNYLQQKNKLLNEYFKSTGHYQPNSTDIHSVFKIRRIDAYLCKYLSKQNNNSEFEAITDSREQPLLNEIIFGNMLSCSPTQFHNRYEICGKTWDSSVGLRGKKFFSVEMNSINQTMFHEIEEDKKTTKKDFDYGTIIYTEGIKTSDILSPYHMDLYQSFTNSILE